MSKLNEKINNWCNRVIVSNQEHEGLGVMLLGTVNGERVSALREHIICVENGLQEQQSSQFCR